MVKVKAKAPKAEAVQEDPAVKAQRLAAEKAAQDSENATVSDIMSKKTRLKARVYGGASGGGGSGGSAAAFGGAPSGSSAAASAAAKAKLSGFNVNNIWRGGAY